MTSLDKFNRSCNPIDNLFTKICVLSETKDVNIKVFDMIIRMYEAKTLMKLIHANINENLIPQLVIQIKNKIIIQ